MSESTPSEEALRSLSHRITFRYEGGPFDGRVQPHYPKPDEPEKPVLHHLVTCAKDDDTDYEAQGIYHLEQRAGEWAFEWVAVHHPSEQDYNWRKLEPAPEPVAVAKLVPERKKKEPIPLPDNHRLVKLLANVAAIKARRKERDERA